MSNLVVTMQMMISKNDGGSDHLKSADVEFQLSMIPDVYMPVNHVTLGTNEGP